MVIKMTVALKQHDTLLSFRTERKVAYQWVRSHAGQIDSLEIDCGLNIWSWSRYTGWTQFPQIVYTPGKGTYHAHVKPIRHGNAYDARHPWRFCFGSLTPNPLSFIAEDSLF